MRSGIHRPHRLLLCVWVIAASAAPVAGQTVQYVGSWNNTTFGSTGPASLTTSVSGADFTAVFDLDNGPGGTVFGQPVNPDPVTLTGTLGPGGTLSGLSATPNPHHVYGPMTLSGTGVSDLTINMPDIPAASLTSGLMTGGRQANGSFLFNYSVNFTTGGGAVGTVTLIPVPEPGYAAASTLLALKRRPRRRG